MLEIGHDRVACQLFPQEDGALIGHGKQTSDCSGELRTEERCVGAACISGPWITFNACDLLDISAASVFTSGEVDMPADLTITLAAILPRSASLGSEYHEFRRILHWPEVSVHLHCTPGIQGPDWGFERQVARFSHFTVQRRAKWWRS